MTETLNLRFELGTFKGYQAAICFNLTAHDVVNWDHNARGEAEFWPSGDHPGVSLLFKGQNSVTGSEIIALDKLLGEFRSDSTETFLSIYYAAQVSGVDLTQMTFETVASLNLHVFLGGHFRRLRAQAAYRLFELYYPEAYAAWERFDCDGLMFDTNAFLGSPSFSTLEVTIGEEKALLVCPQ